MKKRYTKHNSSKHKKSNKKAWILSVDMGYGHQRAAYPLKDIAYERIITSNSDKIITKHEKKLWKRSRAFYEWVSRMTSLPIIGRHIFKLYDKLQYISAFYPFRDLSKPTLQVYYLIRLLKKGLNKSTIEYVKTKKIPFVTTYFLPAIAADFHKLNNIYCVVTDSDINRVWVTKCPAKSKINYLAPTKHTVNRLLQYGVPKKRIFLTGFPLPKENLGGTNLKILKKDISKRLINLDPNRIFIKKFKTHLKKHGANISSKCKPKTLTLTFAIGGAGAQKDIAFDIIKSLKRKILKKEVNLNIVTGIRMQLKQEVENFITKLDLSKNLEDNLKIISAMTKKDYFVLFNQTLRTTDVLWTKPSELCFYSALGLPIIIAPPVGAHEDYNFDWMNHHRFGIHQEDPKFANEWLFKWVEDGRLAEIAWKGFLDAPKFGTYNIEKVIFSKDKKNLKLK